MAAAKPQAPAQKTDGGLRISRLTGLKKRQQIELAGRYMFIWVVVAAIAVSFCVATGQYLFNKWVYNNKVLSAKYTASDTLGKNITAATELKKQVDSLVANNDLASVKTDPNDTATKSVLDALPITDDSAALATSLQQAILSKSGVSIQSITVPAESAAAQGTTSTPQEMKFSFVVTGTYDKIKTMVHDLERTIRPIKITDISMTGSDANLQANVDAITYYQPAKTVNAREETVK
ncbi:MAG TPA: type 4a pilus biogenesis protein PilO [Candidatus Saccharimonas sp.]|nr:type 4a pilus biogenesis protein PilO [Candidatus Saccharimonas sp.]